MANAVEQAAQYGGRAVDEEWLLNVAQRSLLAVETYHPSGYDELSGVAAGSGLSVDRVWAMNALTDLRDVAAFAHDEVVAGLAEGEGCSSIVVHGSTTEDGRALGAQTWDLGTDNMPFVRLVERAPDRGPRTLALTTVGCLSLIGINSSGLAVGTTNLRTLDARIGVGYLDVIHRALSADSFEEARRAIREAPRAGAHYFYLVGDEGRVGVFECTATRVVETGVPEGFYVHCNHVLDTESRALEAQGTPVASTHHRQARLTQLAEAAGRLSPAFLRDFFSDDEGGPLAINRKDFAGISSNASVVMEPSTRRLWAVHGPADEGTWQEWRLGGNGAQLLAE